MNNSPKTPDPLPDPLSLVSPLSRLRSSFEEITRSNSTFNLNLILHYTQYYFLIRSTKRHVYPFSLIKTISWRPSTMKFFNSTYLCRSLRRIIRQQWTSSQSDFHLRINGGGKTTIFNMSLIFGFYSQFYSYDVTF